MLDSMTIKRKQIIHNVYKYNKNDKENECNYYSYLFYN